MSELFGRAGSAVQVAGFVLLAMGRGVAGHWALAVFSLIAGFGIWFVVQDVENPRIEVTAPIETEAAVPVEAVNVGQGLVALDIRTVRVIVEVREEDVGDLRAADFIATVDAEGLTVGGPVELPVSVESRRSDVTVIRAEPARVAVEIAEAATREVAVEVNETGELPVGFQLGGLPDVEPAFVTITGRRELVESVDRVEVDVSLSGLRQTAAFDREIVARTETGSRVILALSQTRARVTLEIVEATPLRTLAVTPASPSGRPADGFAVTNVSVEPALVTVSGPRDVVDGLDRLTFDPVDVTEARSDVIQTRPLILPENVEAEVETVVVTVTIEPIVSSRTFVVAPVFTTPPEGIVLAPGVVYSVDVVLSGPLEVLDLVDPAAIVATVSLAGAVAGTADYGVEVTPIPELTVESAGPLSVTLQPASSP